MMNQDNTTLYRHRGGSAAWVLLAVMAMTGGAAGTSWAQERVLEEIIVTGHKREQSLRDVAATVNVVSGELVRDLNLLSFEDLERVTAGLQLIRPNPRNVTMSIRGVYFDPESGSSSSVDVYQNGIPQRADDMFGALYDIGNVEVLRGPQGSLQGATSPAGAILVNTARPDPSELTGYAQVTHSEDNNGLNVQGAISLPLIENRIAVRLAAYTDENDQNNVRNLRTDRVQDVTTDSWRASILWQPDDNWEFVLTRQNIDQRLYGTPSLAGSRDMAAAFAGVPGIPCAVLPPSAQALCVTLDADDRAAFAAGDTRGDRDADLTTLNVQWDVSDTFSVNYAYGHTDSTKTARTENDISSNIDLQTAFYTFGLRVMNDTDYRTEQGTTTTTEGSTHELRFTTSGRPFWNAMLGFYYRDLDTSTDFYAYSVAARYIPGSALMLPFPGAHLEGINIRTQGTIPVDSETQAVFTMHSFNLTDATTLDLALRYQEIEGFRQSPIRFGGFNQRDRITLANVPLPPPVAEQVINGVLAGVIAGSTIDGVPVDQQTPSEDAITGTLALSHDFSEALTGYVSYNRSFRGGGISINPGETIPVEDQIYDEETADSFEIGAKAIFLNGQAEVNAVIYHQIFDGYLGFVRELEYVNAAGQVDPLTGGLVFNGDATSSGIEVDWRLAASENWTLGGTLSYNKAEFDDADVPCNIRTGNEALGRCSSSERIPGSTELQGSLYAEYLRQVGEYEFFIRGNAKYNGGILSTRAVAFGDDPGETDSTVLADLFIGFGGERWEISAFVKNLLDEDAQLDLRNPGNATFDPNGDFVEVLLQPERTYGLIGRVSF